MNSAAKTKKKVKNRLKSNILKGTLILSCASILSRIIGFIYRIYLADILGEQLLGTYQLIFPIYVLCFTIYGAGMQSAISQVVATLMGKNNTHPQDSNFKDNTSKYSSSSIAVSKNNNNSSLVKGNYPFVSSSARNITPRTILLAGTILSFILALFLSIFINFKITFEIGSPKNSLRSSDNFFCCVNLLIDFLVWRFGTVYTVVTSSYKPKPISPITIIRNISTSSLHFVSRLSYFHDMYER